MQESLGRQVYRCGALRVRNTPEQADRGVPRYDSFNISLGVATPSYARRANVFTVLNTGSLFELQSNATRQARRTAGARHERTLAAVACTRLLGASAAAPPHI